MPGAELSRTPGVRRVGVANVYPIRPRAGARVPRPHTQERRLGGVGMTEAADRSFFSPAARRHIGCDANEQPAVSCVAGAGHGNGDDGRVGVVPVTLLYGFTTLPLRKRPPR